MRATPKKSIRFLFALVATAFFCVGCTADGKEATIEPDDTDFHAFDDVKESDSPKSSESKADSSGTIDFPEFAKYVQFVQIPEMTLSRGEVSYSVSKFSIATIEVTQGLYKAVMGAIPEQNAEGDSVPVANVSWYDAVLFCNALSKKAGVDTVYTYKSVGQANFLEGLKTDFSASGFRLPTETEWEIAARGGTTSRYYWGEASASKYAYYGQSRGPVEVASYEPNKYNLYDMAGNVAEWTNDWFGSYSASDQMNYRGAETGDYKCVRGGGWTNKAADLSPRERDKKDPLYKSLSLGFRIVYSDGME